MALSDTALRVLTDAGQHALRLATSPKHLPAAACNAVLRSLLKGGYVEECPAPFEYSGLGWRQQDGAWTALRVTNAGLLAIGAEPRGSAEGSVDRGMVATALEAPEEARSGSRAASAALESLQVPDAADAVPEAAKAASASATRTSLRNAAQRVLSAWDDEAEARPGLPAAINAPRVSGCSGAINITSTEIAPELKRDPGVASNTDKLQAAPLRQCAIMLLQCAHHCRGA
jgi:hypothetical protein